MKQQTFDWGNYSSILGGTGLDSLKNNAYSFTPYVDPQYDGVLNTDINKYLSEEITDATEQSLSGKGYEKVFKNKENEYSAHEAGEWMVTDAFKTFYNDRNKLNIKPQQYWWHHLITKMNNHLLKLVTKDNKGYSYIAMKAIIEKLMRLLMKMTPEDRKEAIQEANESLANGEKPSNDLFKQMEKAIEAGVKKASKDIKNAEESFGKNAGKGLKDNIELCEIAIDPQVSKAISLNRSEINRFVKHVADRAIEATYGVPEVIEESFFESDTADIDDLVNIEDFAHVALLEDLSIKRKRYSINFDIYLDDSGSMSSNICIEGKYIKMSTLARILGLKLHLMGLVKDIYLFSCDIKKVSLKELFKVKFRGGTNIEKCIVNAKEVNRASIIITDGYDSIKTYFDKCYFIGLGLNRTHESFETFSKKGKFHFYNEGSFVDSEIYEEETNWGIRKYVIAKGSNTN
tara:strand:+ start:10635 stop:12011 length:1377 start_codon:yes stop_codon:yes gene_type:complete